MLQKVEAFRRRDLLAAETVPARDRAAHHHRVHRNAKDLPVLRNVLTQAALGRGLLDDLAIQQLRLRRCRPCLHDLLRAEEVPLRCALLRERLGPRGGQEAIQRARGDRYLRDAADRRPGEIRLEVVELEDRGFPDHLRGAGRIVDAGELDDDLVRALLADLGLGDAELVDPLPHDVDRASEIVGRKLVPLRRDRLQDDLEAAL